MREKPRRCQITHIHGGGSKQRPRLLVATCARTIIILAAKYWRDRTAGQNKAKQNKSNRNQNQNQNKIKSNHSGFNKYAYSYNCFAASENCVNNSVFINHVAVRRRAFAKHVMSFHVREPATLSNFSFPSCMLHSRTMCSGVCLNASQEHAGDSMFETFFLCKKSTNSIFFVRN